LAPANKPSRHWPKIKKSRHSQLEGREELFEGVSERTKYGFAVIRPLTLIRNYKPTFLGGIEDRKQARNSPHGFLFGREVA